jgi:hypothetical protein
MNNLGRAAQKLIPELEKYNIKVYMLDYRIEWVIPQGTWEIQMRRWLPVWWYRRNLRKLIKIAKQYEGRL